MIRKVIVCGAAALTMALSVSAARASGSDAGGGAETGDAAAYNMGKSVYANKFACTGCSMAGKSLDVPMAKKLLGESMDKMDKMHADLTPDEKHALEVYLKRRFKL